MQLYHSVHARGERVEDVLRDTEAREEGIALGSVATTGAANQKGDVDCEMLEDGEVAEGEANSVPYDEEIETKGSVSPSLISLRALADPSFRSRHLSIPIITSKPT